MYVSYSGVVGRLAIRKGEGKCSVVNQMIYALYSLGNQHLDD